MKTVYIPALAVEQPIGTVFVAKMDAKELLRLSSNDRRRIDNEDDVIGIQRPLKQDKIREIKKYITSQKATIPTSIIVNVRKENVINQDKHGIEVKDSEDTFTIIDGQHRLYGFEGYNGRPFELILSIFIGLEVSLQSEVFSIMNSQQAIVDSPINIDLVLSDDTNSPRKTILQIAQAFNVDKQSPWHQQITPSEGQGSGMISLASFVRPLFYLTYPERLWTDIKHRLEESKPQFPSDWKDLNVATQKYPFWSFYVNQQPAVIYKILFNYYTAFSHVLDSDWMNQESLLNKVPGYNAMMRLFRIVFSQGIEVGDLTEGFFFKTLSPLSKMKGTITSAIYGSSELFSSNMLYRDMLCAIGFQEEDKTIAEYNKAIELNPSDVEAYRKRGNLKRMMKDYEGALRDFNMAIELDPSNAEAYQKRGNLKRMMKDYLGAFEDYNQARKQSLIILNDLNREAVDGKINEYIEALQSRLESEWEGVQSSKPVQPSIDTTASEKRKSE